MMKEYKAPALTMLSIPEEDILTASDNTLVLGGRGGIELDSDEIFGGFHAY